MPEALVVSSIVSLDGYVAGPRRRHGAAHGRVLRRLQPGAAARCGHAAARRDTYLGLKAHWPAVAEDPSRSPAVQLDPGVADLHREMGRRNNELRKVVVSDSLTERDTPPWTDTPTIAARARSGLSRS